MIFDTLTFKITVVVLTCSQSLDVLTITPPTLSNQAYIWTESTGSYIIPEFIVLSSQLYVIPKT